MTAPKKKEPKDEPQFRALSFVPASFNPEARTVDVTWTTGARVLRQMWDGSLFYEDLVVTRAACDIKRLNSGAPLLNVHSGQYDARTIWGAMVPGSVRIQDGQGHGTVQFDDADNDPDAEKVFRKIGKGIIRGASVGYRVLEMKRTKEEVNGIPVFRVTKWEPFEVSVAPIQADLKSKFRSLQMEDDDTTTNENPAAPTEGQRTQPQASGGDDRVRAEERARCDAIRSSCELAGLGDEFARGLVNAGTPIDQARASIFAEMARRSEASDTPRGSVLRSTALGFDRFADNSDQVVQDVAAGRMGALELARRSLQSKGISIPTNNQRLIERAMQSTSDFPAVLDASVGANLRVGFENEPASHRLWVRVESVPDFNEQKRPILGAAPGLEKVNEGGEYTHGALDEDTTSYKVEKYGRIVSLSWETMVTDRLGAWLRTIPALGQAAKRKEADTVYSLFALNSATGPTMQDGVVLFHADHKNLTSSGTFNAALLAAGRTLLRKQTGVGGGYLALQPHALIVPAELEHDAELLLAAATRVISSTQEADAPKWLQGLVLCVEPRLPATAAYLTADPSQIDSFVLGVLEENMAGPYTETKNDFEQDRRLMKIRHVFGAKATDYRGIVKMPVS